MSYKIGMKQITITKEAIKTLNKLPKNVKARIRSKIDQYASDPESMKNNVKKLQGEFEGVYRLRVGDWRVFFTEDGKVIAVIKIRPRGGAY